MLITSNILDADFLNKLATSIDKMELFKFNQSSNMLDVIDAMTQYVTMEEIGDVNKVIISGSYIPVNPKDGIVYSFISKVGRTGNTIISLGGFEYQLNISATIKVNEVTDIYFENGEFNVLEYDIDLSSNERFNTVTGLMVSLRNELEFYQDNIRSSSDLVAHQGSYGDALTQLDEIILEMQNAFIAANSFDSDTLKYKLSHLTTTIGNMNLPSLEDDSDAFKDTPVGGLTDTVLDEDNRVILPTMFVGSRISDGTLPVYVLGSTNTVSYQDFLNEEGFFLTSPSGSVEVDNNGVLFTLVMDQVIDQSSNTIIHESAEKIVLHTGQSFLIGPDKDVQIINGDVDYSALNIEAVIPKSFTTKSIDDIDVGEITIVQNTRAWEVLTDDPVDTFGVELTNPEFIAMVAPYDVMIRESDVGQIKMFRHLGYTNSIPESKMILREPTGIQFGSTAIVTLSYAESTKLLSGYPLGQILLGESNTPMLEDILKDDTLDVYDIKFDFTSTPCKVYMHPSSPYFIGKLLVDNSNILQYSTVKTQEVSDIISNSPTIQDGATQALIEYYDELILELDVFSDSTLVNNTSTLGTDVADTTNVLSDNDSMLTVVEDRAALYEDDGTIINDSQIQNLADTKTTLADYTFVKKWLAKIDSIELDESSTLVGTMGSAKHISLDSPLGLDGGLDIINMSSGNFNAEIGGYTIDVGGDSPLPIVFPSGPIESPFVIAHEEIGAEDFVITYLGPLSDFDSLGYSWNDIGDSLDALPNNQSSHIGKTFPTRDFSFPTIGHSKPVISYSSTPNTTIPSSDFSVVTMLDLNDNGFLNEGLPLAISGVTRSYDGANIAVYNYTSGFVSINILFPVSLDVDAHYAANLVDDKLIIGKKIELPDVMTPQLNPGFVLTGNEYDSDVPLNRLEVPMTIGSTVLDPTLSRPFGVTDQEATYGGALPDELTFESNATVSNGDVAYVVQGQETMDGEGNIMPGAYTSYYYSGPTRTFGTTSPLKRDGITFVPSTSFSTTTLPSGVEVYDTLSTVPIGDKAVISEQMTVEAIITASMTFQGYLVVNPTGVSMSIPAGSYLVIEKPDGGSVKLLGWVDTLVISRTPNVNWGNHSISAMENLNMVMNDITHLNTNALGSLGSLRMGDMSVVPQPIHSSIRSLIVDTPTLQVDGVDLTNGDIYVEGELLSKDMHEYKAFVSLGGEFYSNGDVDLTAFHEDGVPYSYGNGGNKLSFHTGVQYPSIEQFEFEGNREGAFDVISFTNDHVAGNQFTLIRNGLEYTVKDLIFNSGIYYIMEFRMNQTVYIYDIVKPLLPREYFIDNNGSRHFTYLNLGDNGPVWNNTNTPSKAMMFYFQNVLAENANYLMNAFKSVHGRRVERLHYSMFTIHSPTLIASTKTVIDDYISEINNTSEDIVALNANDVPAYNATVINDRSRINEDTLLAKLAEFEAVALVIFIPVGYIDAFTGDPKIYGAYEHKVNSPLDANGSCDLGDVSLTFNNTKRIKILKDVRKPFINMEFDFDGSSY